MQPETIIYVSGAVVTLAIALRAAPEDRAAARLCAGALLLNTLAANLGWYMGMRIAGRDANAACMIVILFAMFRYHRPWSVPLACLAVATMLVRAVFEGFEDDRETLYWYKIAAVNALFVLQLATVVTASLSGGKRVGQFHVDDSRSGGAGVFRGKVGSDKQTEGVGK